MLVIPCDTNSVSSPGLRTLARALEGERLQAAHYWILSDPDETFHHSADGGVDDVSLGVVMTFSCGRMLLTWATPGTAEGLLVATDDDVDAVLRDGRLVDVSTARAWEPFMGKSVSGIRISFVSHAVSPFNADQVEERPWALAVEFEPGATLAVALGELHGDQPRYMPNNLVTMFSADYATSMTVEPGAVPALGHRIP